MSTSESSSCGLLATGTAACSVLSLLLPRLGNDTPSAAIDSDPAVLANCKGARTVLLGSSLFPDHSLNDTRTASGMMTEVKPELQSFIKPLRQLILLSSLGGTTGAAAAIAAVEAALETRIPVVVLAIRPFALEGNLAVNRADRALATLRARADAVLCFDPDELFRLHQILASEAYSKLNGILADSVLTTLAILRSGSGHLDLGSLRSLLNRHLAQCTAGHGSGTLPEQALTALLADPTLGGVEALRRADRVILHISHAADVPLADLVRINTLFSEACSGHINHLTSRAVAPAGAPPYTVQALSLCILRQQPGRSTTSLVSSAKPAFETASRSSAKEPAALFTPLPADELELPAYRRKGIDVDVGD